MCLRPSIRDRVSAYVCCARTRIERAVSYVFVQYLTNVYRSRTTIIDHEDLFRCQTRRQGAQTWGAVPQYLAMGNFCGQASTSLGGRIQIATIHHPSRRPDGGHASTREGHYRVLLASQVVVHGRSSFLLADRVLLCQEEQYLTPLGPVHFSQPPGFVGMVVLREKDYLDCLA